VSEYEDAGKLCELHAGRLAGFLATRGTDSSLIEDIIQDTFLVLCRKGQDVLSHPNPPAYLYKIAQGIAADRRKANESRSANEVAWYRQRQDNDRPGDPIESVASHVDVQAALAQLSLRQREVVYLRRCADLTLDEVADILHVSKGAAKSHLRRGEARLRMLLGDEPQGALA
jgi:RNA polymerase sigma-70 factor (ECF subfamily)